MSCVDLINSMLFMLTVCASVDAGLELDAWDSDDQYDKTLHKDARFWERIDERKVCSVV